MALGQTVEFTSEPITQPIIYHVAVSIDGYICGPDGDISKFPDNRAVMNDYFGRLSTYTCAVMGRATYEFGFRFGLKNGENPYLGMDTYVFSTSLEVPDGSDITVVRSQTKTFLSELRQAQSGPIYLCGGGRFAGALVLGGEIDLLRLKRAPIILGAGTRLFEGGAMSPSLTFEDAKTYDGVYLFQEFKLLPSTCRPISQ